ncbi:MAG: radical SAM protein [Blastocatellia bacterium]
MSNISNQGSREEKRAKLKVIGDVLAKYTHEGELYEQLADNKVFCYSCGHRCRIADGLAGVCKVRFNEGGKLQVPWGYVAGLQCDPIEKKPFFHAMPSTDALSFGMLGCDLHCDYCFSGETMVVTDKGTKTFQEIFESSTNISYQPNAEIVYPHNLQVFSQSGKLQNVKAIFKHHYQGQLIKLIPYYLPPISCTPDHKIYVTSKPNELPKPIAAKDITIEHYLVVPKNCHTVVWYEENINRRNLVETEDYYLVKLKSIESENFAGNVYNMEVEEEHNYLANFFLVSNCQNWITSQVLRDPNAVAPAKTISAEQMLDIAEREGVSTVTSTYNEPLITSEWAVSIFKQAKEKGFLTAYVSNGNGTPEVLDYLQPWVDLYKVDLKSFRDKNYRELGGLLVNVLETIQGLKARGFWLEIVTLVIPGFNDSQEELQEMAEFLVSVDPFIPWHLTAFHSDYKMMDKENTNIKTLIKAAEIGKKVGLKYVYIGNAAGRVGRWENTWCHNCNELLIERYAYHIKQFSLQNGKCAKCKATIPGRWSSPRFPLGYQISKSNGWVKALRF